MGSIEDVIVSFEILNEQGVAATRFARGARVRFRIQLSNPTERDIYTTYTAPGYDIAVYASDTEKLVWQSSADQVFMQMIQDFVIEAGATRRLVHDWDLSDTDGASLPPGRYEARARLNIGSIGALEAQTFTIQ